jgi:glycosyltransferase involved in cell wall biosynthesis
VLSFLVPAHDEETTIVATVQSVYEAAAGRDYEVVVVADACTDRTAELARAHGARVVEVAHRQIAATRNAGAQAARGDVFVFVDADTRVSRAVVDGLCDAIARGAVGGGALVRFDEPMPRWARIATPMMTTAYFTMKLAAGCFVFATREAFAAVGGFDRELYAAEEVEFSRALKRFARAAGQIGGQRARFVVLRDRVETSSRKLRTYSGWQMLRELLRLAMLGRRGVRRREGLSFWYGPRQRDPASPT